MDGWLDSWFVGQMNVLSIMEHSSDSHILFFFIIPSFLLFCSVVFRLYFSTSATNLFVVFFNVNVASAHERLLFVTVPRRYYNHRCRCCQLNFIELSSEPNYFATRVWPKQRVTVWPLLWTVVICWVSGLSSYAYTKRFVMTELNKM